MEDWDRYLYVPTYLATSAARYVDMPVGQVRYWQRVRARQPGNAGRSPMLNYPELIELSVVSSFKKAGLRLARIRVAHEYLSGLLGTLYPFATHKLSTEGTHIISEMPQDVREQSGFDRLLLADQRGQLAWKPVILDRYHQFVYET
ncbi:MAG: hypothetical protein K6T30_08670, partial [Alicyclobacillus sp.]|nr:hypothetical protein [Alicyclobacillus sp.]